MLLRAAVPLLFARPAPFLSRLDTTAVRMFSDIPLAKLTVVQLKEKLREAGMPVSGRKAELIERLGGAGAAPMEATPAAAPVAGLSIIVEACKQWGAFKSRAAKVAKACEAAGVACSINADKPRRGVFEVRSAGGTVFVTTGPEARPFPALKALDIESIAAAAVAACTDEDACVA